MASKVHVEKRLQDTPRTQKEEDRVRAQLLRLENEKQRIKQQKQEDFQRRLSQQADDAIARKAASTERQRIERDLKAIEQDRTPTSRSAHSKSPAGESKLFDYEITQPRSRRQLQASDISGGTSRAGTDTGRTSGASHKKAHRGSLPAPQIHVLPEPVRSKTGGFDDRPDLEMRRAGSRTGVTAERKVNFDGINKLGADTAKYTRARAKSIADPTKVQLPTISVEESELDSDTQKLKDLYNLAIERVKSVDEAMLAQTGGVPGGKMKTFSSSSFAKGFDTETLKELETILKDARIFSNRRSSQEDHTRPDLSSNRAQKKRIEHLERVLQQLKPEDKHADFSPFQVLQCSYLRLSKSNIETLEKMCKEQGTDPGIHVHKDVTNYDIWEGLQEERRDNLEEKAQIEAQRAQMEAQREERRASLAVPAQVRVRRESVDAGGTGQQSQEPETAVPVHNRQRRASLDVAKH